MSKVMEYGYCKEVTQEGSGDTPQKGQKVTVHCTGIVQSSGKKFWSTKDEGQEPFSFQIGLGKVIKAWDEGVATMKEGEFATLTASPDYAYGERGFPAWGIPENATLIFHIELLSIE
eukprot:TRINITY_DN28262_c1_g4_i1.p1 TRINITY_DN28262_c1_g4~~TRINITY_DN28262_c1_g4_i1.p1  ORF type:complete len:117 (+),score=42.12 TRINITY_DN28262_c1_g4_i1:347-697(+)